MKVAKKELKNYYDKKGGKMTKKFITLPIKITPKRCSSSS